jgi:hypothetical protein
MKKALVSPMLLCCGVLLVCLAGFFWKDLQDSGPAIKSPAVDIVRLVEQLDADAPDFKKGRIKAYPFNLRTMKVVGQTNIHDRGSRNRTAPGKGESLSRK